MKPMIYSFFLLLVVLCQILISPYQVLASPSLSSTTDSPTVFQLLEKQQELDGTTVTFSGEVIGQPIHDKKGVFVNVMDKEYNALGVYLHQSDLTQLTHFGRHGVRGDYIKVTGTFRQVCPDHGGDTDLHASFLTIVAKGRILKTPLVPQWKIILSIALLLVSIFLLFGKERPSWHK